MDKAILDDAKKALSQLQTYRNQMIGLGLMIPDLQRLIDLLSQGDQEIMALESKRQAIESEIGSLKGSKAEFDKKREAQQRLYDDFTKQVDDRRAVLESEISALGQKKIAAQDDLAKEITNRQTTLSALDQQIASSQATLDKIQSDVEKLKRKWD